MRPTNIWLSVCVAACLLASCGDDGSPVASDAARNRDATAGVDATSNTDAIPSLGWVDFTITGCASGNAVMTGGGGSDAGTADPCVGTAPLTLQFTAVAPSLVELYRWDFAGEQVNDPTPMHTFTVPGSYNVALTVGGPGGTAMTTKLNIVVVSTAPIGSNCSLDAQCETGECICDNQTSCAAGVSTGICSAPCSAATPCNSGACVNLDVAAGGSEDWQQQLCLSTCNDDTECPGNLRCRQLLNDAGAWISACFTGALLGDIGASCDNATGVVDNTNCTSGRCLDEGARGVCSHSCTFGSCPFGSACATFNTSPAGSWCVARCDALGTCETDPWLACEPPGNSGSKGFGVDETIGGATYCAPKSCTEVGECGADGTCVDGFCSAAL